MPNRLTYIDLAKGIGIILVVLAHTMNEDRFTYKVIYSFHMPLFFFLSGFVISNKQVPFKDFITKKAKSLLIPTFWFTLIIMLVKAIDGHIEDVNMITHQFPYSMWFLPIMFFAHLGYYTLSKLQKPIFVIGLIALSSAGFILSYYNVWMDFFNLICILPAIFYLHLGHFMKKVIEPYIYTLQDNVSGWGKKVAISLLLIVALILTTFVFNIKTCFFYNIFQPLIPAIIVSVIGILLTISLSINISRIPGKLRKTLIFLGRNSLTIMCVHQLFIFLFNNHIAQYFQNHIANKAAELVFISVLSVCSIYLVKRIPFLIGKKRTSDKSEDESTTNILT